jgi:hypothetical protein
MNEELIERIYESIVVENTATYQRLFEQENGPNTIDYWVSARRLYQGIDDSQKDTFFWILRSVIIDTVSNVLGAIDGTVAIDDRDWDLRLSIDGIGSDGTLQDCFLEHVEAVEGGA